MAATSLSPADAAARAAAKAAAATPAAPVAAGPVRVVTPARAPSSALAALLAMLPTDAPAAPAARQPKWLEQVQAANLTAGQQAFLSRIGWSGIVAADGEPESYSPEARRDVRLPSAAKLRKMKKPGGLISDSIIAAMAQKGSVSVVDALAIYNSESVKISSISGLLNRVGRVLGYSLELHSNGDIVASGVAAPGFYQGGGESGIAIEAALRQLGADALERQYKTNDG